MYACTDAKLKLALLKKVSIYFINHVCSRSYKNVCQVTCFSICKLVDFFVMMDTDMKKRFVLAVSVAG